jgi:hypothetical protein
MDWLAAFVFTQLVEVPLYRWLARLRLDEAFAASAMTHPVVWWIIPRLFDDAYLAWIAPHPTLWLSQTPRYVVLVIACELYAVGVEAFYLRARGVRSPLLLAFIVNMASVGLGLTSRHLFGVP